MDVYTLNWKQNLSLKIVLINLNIMNAETFFIVLEISHDGNIAESLDVRLPKYSHIIQDSRAKVSSCSPQLYICIYCPCFQGVGVEKCEANSDQEADGVPPLGPRSDNSPVSKFKFVPKVLYKT